MKFEVLVSDQYIVLKNGKSSLWWNRSHTTPTNNPNVNSAFNPKVAPTPEFKILNDDDQTIFSDFTCHGMAYGLAGVFLSDKLILIKQCQSIGRLPFGSKDEVFKIQKICVLSLCNKGDPLGDLGLDKCSQDTCTKPVIIIPSPNEPFISASFKDSMIEESSLTFHTGFGSSQPSGGSGVQKTWNQIKLTASNVKPRVSDKLPLLSGTSKSNNQQLQSGKMDEKEKYERRFIDELYKMFNETNSFYFSWTGDLTQSVQRQQKLKQHYDKQDIRTIPLWKRVDDRFFWNKYMLRSLIEIFEAMTPTNEESASIVKVLESDADLKTSSSFSHLWVLPIIQGFVQIEKCFFDLNESSPVGCDPKDFPQQSNGSTNSPAITPISTNSTLLGSVLEGRDYYLMTLISRRSRFRAGTRYKKRGVDENGRCANYVETEQIFTYGSHTVSFVCVRGSVPLFWSQLGHKYRPPPRLERTEVENKQAFRRHFEHEFAIYEGDVIAINLIERTGREKILGDAFLDAAIKLDDARLAYYAFDFHDYCRGMRFENVSILIDRIYEFIKEIRYCWVDDDGMICEQRGVFRINCIDCLDRTNIVMTAVAKAVMDIQLVRLGLLPPEGQLPSNSRRIFQLMWAHNGDIISRQYAGTVALKGDYTRTGERKISGVVRDGYNSANRYYLNRFKDAYRQAVIDIMQGNPVSDALSSPDNEKSSSSSIPKSSSGTSLSSSLTSQSLSSNDQEYHERIKLVIEDCKKILVPQEEVILGGWPLVDADPVTGVSLSATRITGEMPESEMDIVLILTKDCYYVADYDDQTDRIVKYQKVLLEDLEKIELGAEPNYQAGPFGQIRVGQNRNIISYAVRFHYCINEQSGYFHMFRSTGTRFFNNMAIPIRTREEALESLKAICESFKVALSVKSLNVPFHEMARLERRKSKRLYSSSALKLGSNSSNNNTSVDSINLNGRFRNMSETIGNTSTNSGANSRKLFTGMYSHLSRLRGKLTGNSANVSTGSSRAGLQLDGINKGTSLYDTTFDEELEPPLTPEKQCSLNVQVDDDEDDDSDEDDSIVKIRKKRYIRQGQNSTANSSSSSLIVERTSSDLSESDFEDSELMLPPIHEIGSPSGMEDEPLCRKEMDMDRVLESCGILVTSPPLRYTPQGSLHKSPELDSSTHSLLSLNKTKSVLHDVDDFVLDSMKKASLRQLHRKAVSKSQISLCSSTTSIHSNVVNMEGTNPRISIDPSGMDSNMSARSSSRCIFSSELALNSIACQSIKKDIINKLSSSVSTDALDVGGSVGGGGNISSTLKNDQPNLAYQCAAYPLMSSSSFAALSYNDDNESSSLNILPDNIYLPQLDDSSLQLNRANMDNDTLLAIISKESSLSVSDLVTGLNAGLKTSRSSTALQSNTSGYMSLNLPSINSSSTINILGDNESNIQHSGNSSAAMNFTNSLMVKKDLVLSPLTRIAKGMQSLGLGLRGSITTEQTMDSSNMLQDAELEKRKKQTRSRIIEM